MECEYGADVVYWAKNLQKIPARHLLYVQSFPVMSPPDHSTDSL
jgi:hypothetical protein